MYPLHHSFLSACRFSGIKENKLKIIEIRRSINNLSINIQCVTLFSDPNLPLPTTIQNYYYGTGLTCGRLGGKMRYLDISRRNFLLSSTIAAIMHSNEVLSQSTPNDRHHNYTNPETKVVTFTSKLYFDEQRYAVSATDRDSSSKPLIVVLLPGQFSNLQRSANHCEQIVTLVKDAGESAVVIIPGGRGNGTVFQGYGQIDVLEAIQHVSTLYNIDRERISVMGGSMGGAATWYMSSHYPDFFSAVATFAGYCDYRLWQKPGGLTFPMMEWEEFSWKSRSASDCVENYINTPVWILHGEWDRTIGGGVDVIQSQSMAKKLQALGYNYRYTELPERGHNSYDRNATYFRDVILWLIKQKRISSPKRIHLVCHELRYNKNHYVSIEQLQQYGRPGRAETEFVEDTVLTVKTGNLRTLQIHPIPEKKHVTIEIDNQVFEKVNLGNPATFMFNRVSGWEKISPEKIPVTEKHHGASGPFGDLFYERTAIVYGSTGGGAENHMMAQMARNAARFYNEWNGGVHRGGIKGENEVNIPVIKDTKVDDTMLNNYNLFCIGTFATNALLKKYQDTIPVVFGKDELTLAGKSFKGKDVALIAAFAHPDNSNRYVAVLGGVSDDAITWASHLNLALLPDYLVFERENVIQWGFFDNNWRI